MQLDGPTYYEALGISPVATPDEIKKRYRELARIHHPDVAKAPGSLEKFKQINEANRILSDPTTRMRYDSELALRAHRTAPSNPFETTTPNYSPANTNPGPNPSPSHSSKRTQTTQHLELLQEAQTHFSRLRYREAEHTARQALRLNRRDPRIYDLLGDIEQKRGRIDEAISYYSYALQLDRHLPGLQRKFDKITGQQQGATMTGHAARSARATGPLRPESAYYAASASKFGLILLMFFGVGGFIVCGVVLYFLLTRR